MCLSRVLFFLVVALRIDAQQNDCDSKLTTIFQESVKLFVNNNDIGVTTPNQALTLHYIETSGKSINDLGNYRACINSQTYDSNYYIAMLERSYSSQSENRDSEFFAPMNPRNLKLGLCVPSECGVEQISTNVLNITQQYLITKYNVTYVEDTGTEPDYISNYGNSAYMLTIIIISVLLVLLGILGVFIEKTTLGDHQKEDDYPMYGSGHRGSHKRRPRSSSLRRQSSNADQVMAKSVEYNKEEGMKKHTTLSRQTPLIIVARKKSLIGKILLCFSLLNNFLGIIRRSTHRYSTLDGLRAFYLAWLTYANTYFYSLRYATNINYESIQSSNLHDLGFSLLVTLPVIAAGSYYFMSGFLSLNWLLHMQAVKYGRAHCCMLLGRYYVYRLIRIWPVYIYILFGTLYLSGIFVSGPQYQDYEQINYTTDQNCLRQDRNNLNSCAYHVCQYYWNIFFLNSPYPSKSCLQPWSSFFATDMLCVLILPMLVFLAQVKRRYERPFKFAYITAFILLVVGLVCAIGVNQNNPVFVVFNYSSFWLLEQSMYPLNYIAPFCLGMILALFMRDTEYQSFKKTIAEVSLFRYLLYGAGVLLFVIIALYNWLITSFHATGGKRGDSNPFSDWNYLIPIAILLYSSAFSIFIFSSFIERARIMTWFLSSRMWTIVARLYLCAFLVQPVVILVYVLSQETAVYMRTVQAFYMSVANLAISLLVAFILCLLVEMPSRNIRRLFVRFTIKNDISNTSQFPLLEREMKYLRKGSEYMH